MNAGFRLWITLHLFGQITGSIRTNYGFYSDKLRVSRTNYGRYPQTYSDKLRALSTDLRAWHGVLVGQITG